MVLRLPTLGFLAVAIIAVAVVNVLHFNARIKPKASIDLGQHLTGFDRCAFADGEPLNFAFLG